MLGRHRNKERRRFLDPSPRGATCMLGGHRFTRNGFGDNRDDLITC
jgi:hypothetical protein